MQVMAKHSNDWSLYEAAHLLNRAGFGGSPVEVSAFHEMGCEAAVEWLLAAKGGPNDEPPAVKTSAWEAQRAYQRRTRKARTDKAEKEAELFRLRRATRQEARAELVSLTRWWVERMCLTQAPLREKMALFWHDHFPTSSQKVNQPTLIQQQLALFRKEALGSFRSLVHGIAEDPAMMIYLDSARSTKENPNENFARELLELFTLGEGHYEERDVKEAARAFTGSRVDRGNGEVIFTPRRWDNGEKQILGARGNFEGRDVVELALAKQECGRYLAKKLWQYFCYDDPSSELVARLGDFFVKSDYEVKPLLRQIFRSGEFYSERAMRTQIKSPLDFLVMLNRQLEMGPIPAAIILPTLERLGQVPFLPPNVAGWDWGKAWVNTNTLLTRYHYAGVVTGAGGEMVSGRPFLNRKMLQNLQSPDFEKIAPRELRDDIPALVASLAFRLFQSPLSDKNRITFESYARAKKGVVFTNTEVAELLHLMMSTPTYQLT